MTRISRFLEIKLSIQNRVNPRHPCLKSSYLIKDSGSKCVASISLK